MSATPAGQEFGTGAPLGDTVRMGQHIFSVGTQSGQLDLVAGAFSAALAEGHRCLFIADRTAPPVFREAMAARGCDIEKPLATGQFQVLTPEETYIRDGYFDADRMLDTWAEAIGSARESGSPGLCASGEVTWVDRGVPGTDRWVEYEYRLNEMEGAPSSAIICLYDQGTLPTWLDSELRKVHPLVHANGVMTANPECVVDGAHAAAVPLAEALEPPIEKLTCAQLAELLSAYVDGHLAPERRERVARHLGACAECGWRLETYSALKGRLAGLRLPGAVPAEFWDAVRTRLTEAPDSSE